jgi:hypothetical protein
VRFSNPSDLVVAICTLVFAGCGERSDDKRLRDLESKTSHLEQTVAKLQAAETRQLQMLIQGPEPKKAVLSATSKGYAFLDCNAGRLLVSCDGATPYLDGYKVSLAIGNPLNVTFSGFRLAVRSGTVPPLQPNIPEVSFWNILSA